MLAAESEKRTQFKLAQLCHSWECYTVKNFYFNRNFHRNLINSILEEDFNINYLFTVDGSLSGSTTILHYAFEEPQDIVLFEILINRNADFTIRNEKGQTVLHSIIQKFLNDLQYERMWCIFDLKVQKFMNIVLSAHVKFKNFENPKFENGISHFHAACIVNHVEAAELFLNNGVAVDECINVKSSEYEGYTPLHFAARFFAFETIRLLLNYGANWYVPCAKGLTPIHLLIQRRIVLFNPKRSDSLVYSQVVARTEKILESEKVLNLLIDDNFSLITGLSNFHIACTSKDSFRAESLFEYITDINHSVSSKSPIFQKYTALHFAAFCDNIDAVKFLLSKGANLNVEIDNRKTPFDLCMQRFEISGINHPIWKNVIFSDNTTRLSDVILSMNNVDEFSTFVKNIKDVNMYIPTSSSLWPGYTLLHLAVIFSKKLKRITNEDIEVVLVKKVLECGTNVNIQDIRGQTAIHLAFRQKKTGATRLLLKHLTSYDESCMDHVDEENLSHLHIACDASDENLISKLLKTSDLRVAYKGKLSIFPIHPGWTPLHLAVFRQNVKIVEMLVNQGANVNAADMEGLTPIHWLINYTRPYYCNAGITISEILFASSALQDCIVPEFGLNYLHVASCVNNITAIEKLIKLGAQHSMMIRYNQRPDQKKPSSFLRHYVSWTPYHFTISCERFCENFTEIIKLLLDYGGDACAQNIEEKFLLKDCNTTRNFMLMLKNNIHIQKSIEERLGLSMLHIACYLAEVELIETLLNQGADVNVRVNLDSPIFPGFTPLHVCSKYWNYKYLDNGKERDTELMIKLLLNYKPDVTLATANGDTPIQTFHSQCGIYVIENKSKIIAEMFRCQSDFSVNPYNGKVSHFHIACQNNDLQIVNRFLQNGPIDVNASIPARVDMRYDKMAGCIPLHLAIMCRSEEFSVVRLEVIDLLLNHASDIHAKDVNGDTPLHKAACTENMRLEIIEKLLSSGACMNAENIEGVTPFEMLLLRKISIPEIQFLYDRGCRVNVFNRFSEEGYLGQYLTFNDEDWERIVKQLIKFLDENKINDAGRTAIHNSVAVSIPVSPDIEIYQQLLNNLLNSNCNVDQQDSLGKTALHCAAQCGNKKGVAVLLKLGVDVNIIDNIGKLALSYSVEWCSAVENHAQIWQCNFCEIISMLLKHVQRLQYLGLEVNKLHSEIEKNYWRIPLVENSRQNFTNALNQSFHDEVERTKNIDFGFGSLTLHSFLSETGAISCYPYLYLPNRYAIDDLFKSISKMRFQEIEGIVMLQYNKAVLRLSLIDQAVNCLRTHLGFSFPGLCEEIIAYLTNSEMKNLILSAM